MAILPRGPDDDLLAMRGATTTRCRVLPGMRGIRASAQRAERCVWRSGGQPPTRFLCVARSGDRRTHSFPLAGRTSPNLETRAVSTEARDSFGWGRCALDDR